MLLATKQAIGTPRYYRLLRQEADFVERSGSGQVDVSVAAWRDADLSDAVRGDLLGRTLDLVVARGPRVLELGSAEGGLAARLARRGCTIDATDISFNLVDMGHDQVEEMRKAESWSGDARFFVSDLNRLALAPNTYDAVPASAVLHHVIDLEYLTNEIFKALKPGGTLICLDHLQASRFGLPCTHSLLFALPTEVPYRRKIPHAFNRLMARVYRRFPQRATPSAFKFPENSPFEDISGDEVLPLIRRQFQQEAYRSHLAFADVVAGHFRMGPNDRDVAMARHLRGPDDWLIQHLPLRGETYFMVARKPDHRG